MLTITTLPINIKSLNFLLYYQYQDLNTPNKPVKELSDKSYDLQQ